MASVTRFKVLVSERLLLRPLTQHDFTLYQSLYGNDNILRYIGPAQNDDDLSNSFKIALKLTAQDPCKRSFLVAEVKNTKKAAGILGITVAESKMQIEVGVMFLAEYQRQHLAFEALQALILFMCQQYVMYDIIADVHPDNRAAVWLARRLGFRYNHLTGIFTLDKQHEYL